MGVPVKRGTGREPLAAPRRLGERSRGSAVAEQASTSSSHPGIHEALVSAEEFTAAHRGHVPGPPAGCDVLSGKVRCGLCGRIIGVDYNEREQALYRCRHRGRGCAQPGRAANGLHRAAVRGLRELTEDEELQQATREELARKVGSDGELERPNRQATVSALLAKRRRLLDLHYQDRISAEAFGEEEARLTRQIEALRSEEAEIEAEHVRRDELAERPRVAELLVQNRRGSRVGRRVHPERRVLVEELIEAVMVFPDHLEVRVVGAPPLNVTLAEVGLREGGTNVWWERGDSQQHPTCGRGR